MRIGVAPPFVKGRLGGICLSTLFHHLFAVFFALIVDGTSRNWQAPHYPAYFDP